MGRKGRVHNLHSNIEKSENQDPATDIVKAPQMNLKRRIRFDGNVLQGELDQPVTKEKKKG